MWSDSETSADFLNYSEVAELIADLVGDRQLLPLSLGVFGGWGTGKSTILNLVELELSKHSEHYLVIKFDAWLYQDFDDARAALMGVISSAIGDNVPSDLKERALQLIGRVNKLRLLGLLLEGGALTLGTPTFGAISKGVTSIGTVLEGKEDSRDVDAIKVAGADIASKVSGLVKANEQVVEPTREINEFRKEFGDILAELNKTLVVFIDNIDRCLPANAIHTLEAIRLFLFMPRTAFIVAADEDMIRHAVAHHFHNPSQRHVADYLDKLIQIPVRVPRIGVQEVRTYLFLLQCSRILSSNDEIEKVRKYLIGKLRESWKREGEFSVRDTLTLIEQSLDGELGSILEMADHIAPTLALSPGVLGNPRIVKRLLNVIRMRASVAKRRSMPLDEAMIAKLALFERCTDNDSTEELHNTINGAVDGKPNILNELERVNVDAAGSMLPEVWKKHSSFLTEWAKLPPKLGGVDLRPAVYLARETIPLRMLVAQASAAAEHAIETLSKVSTMGSPTAKAALEELRSEEVMVVMDGLIAQMRKDPNWERARSDFRGAVMTAERSEEAAIQLARFVRSLQLAKLPGWMSTMVKHRTWWQN